MKITYILKTKERDYVYNNREEAEAKFNSFKGLQIPCYFLKKEVDLFNERQTAVASC